MDRDRLRSRSLTHETGLGFDGAVECGDDDLTNPLLEARSDAFTIARDVQCLDLESVGPRAEDRRSGGVGNFEKVQSKARFAKSSRAFEREGAPPRRLAKREQNRPIRIANVQFRAFGIVLRFGFHQVIQIRNATIFREPSSWTPAAVRDSKRDCGVERAPIRSRLAS